jgi:3-deoxy-D-manno-octulosonate 8-phosphate phosphatase (KDO 8-P phosphatase)
MPKRVQRTTSGATKANSPSSKAVSPELKARLAKVRLLLCDVDGILTDGTVFITEGGEFKQFNIQDGLGQIQLQRNGIKVGWISNRPSPVTAKRAKELKVDFLFQGKGSKVAAIEEVLAQAGCSWNEVCYAGDDLVDLAPLKKSGVAVSVANGIDEAKAIADYVTEARGGEGAVREIVKLILTAQGKWENIVEGYLNT